jgi:hypothetical protein
MSYLAKAQDLYNNYIYTGKLLDGFEKYYGENVIMQEVGETPREGKAANRSYEEQFVASIKEVHGAGITAIAADETNGVVFIENFFDFTNNEGNRYNLVQVAVQHWQGDVIVKEVFFHK